MMMPISACFSSWFPNALWWYGVILPVFGAVVVVKPFSMVKIGMMPQGISSNSIEIEQQALTPSKHSGIDRFSEIVKRHDALRHGEI